jgi:anti-sigma B factor antagonist
MLTCTTHDVEGVLIITLEDAGAGGEEKQASFRESLYKAVQTHETPRFAVDLGRLDSMNSADFGFLISLRRRVETRKGKLVLFNVAEYIVDTLKTMKLISLFPIAPDLRGALALLPTPA